MIGDNNLNHVSFSPLTPVIKVCFHHVHPHVDLIDLYSITLVALVQLAHACLELLQHRTSPDHCNCSRVSKATSGESPTEHSSFVCLRLCSSSKATLTPGALRATSSSVLRRRPEWQQQKQAAVERKQKTSRQQQFTRQQRQGVSFSTKPRIILNVKK